MIIYPFKPRMEIRICLTIIACVWITAAVLTFPYGWYMELMPDEDGQLFCEEMWPREESRKAFGFSTSVLQFVIPFIIISFCYMKVCFKLRDRARQKPGTKSVRKEELERERTRRTNRMLISMVVIFGISWLPLNINNLVQDFYLPATQWRYARAFFLLAHAAAMSSTCYNPFLYAWLNENFRKEFKQVLPCFSSTTTTSPSPGPHRNLKQEPDELQANGNKQEETIQMRELDTHKEPTTVVAVDQMPEPSAAGKTKAKTKKSGKDDDAAADKPSKGDKGDKPSDKASADAKSKSDKPNDKSKSTAVSYMTKSDAVKLTLAPNEQARPSSAVKPKENV